MLGINISKTIGILNIFYIKASYDIKGEGDDPYDYNTDNYNAIHGADNQGPQQVNHEDEASDDEQPQPQPYMIYMQQQPNIQQPQYPYNIQQQQQYPYNIQQNQVNNYFIQK